MELKDKTAIVILNYKNYKDTINCIHSIFKSNNKDYAIIVVDNNSGNNSLELVETEFKNSANVKSWDNVLTQVDDDARTILLVANQHNNGYAAGNNIGLRIGAQLGFKYLMVLNNDTLFTDDCLQIMVNELCEDDTTLCVGPLLYKGNGIDLDYNCAKRRPVFSDFYVLSYFGRWFKTEQWEKNYYYVKKYGTINDTITVDVISGSCMLFDTAKFKEIDFFDEGTFLYFEEAIIHEKARLKNYKLKLVPQAKVIHLGAQTMKNHSHSTFTLRAGYESSIYYLTKWRHCSLFKARLLCFSQYLFYKLYTSVK